jgi:SAM-dependent methyltransferase
VNFGVDTATGAAANTAEEQPVCGWCGHVLAPHAGGPSGRLRCRRCGAQTTWPVPTEAELERAYGSWYRPPDGRFSSVGDRLLGRLRARLAGRLAHIAPPGPVLDVGAGDGALLDALTARGRAAVGLERRSTRDDVRAMDLTEVRERWAAIVFWHSLEHLRDPGATLERAAHLLLPGGVIVIAMPNADSVQARVFGDRWLALDLPRHLVHVPAAALLARLQAVGMHPERISYLRGGQVVFGWLQGIVGTLPTRPDLYDAIRKPEARRVALSRWRRAATLTVGALALPLAVACAVGEASLRRGGTVYVEARHA